MTFSIDQFRLDGKVAIVTGAGGRGNSIGRAYAMGLAAAGAAVVVADINEAGAKAVAEEITATGGKAIGVRVDVTDPAAAAAMAAAAVDAFGGIDILVNNAALMAELGALQAADVPLDEWNRIFSVNLTGALICSQAAIPSMRSRGGGRIVNQTSGGAFPAASVYGVSKLALVGLTTTLAKQLGKEGITANAIAPGNVVSDAGQAARPRRLALPAIPQHDRRRAAAGSARRAGRHAAAAVLGGRRMDHRPDAPRRRRLGDSTLAWRCSPITLSSASCGWGRPMWSSQVKGSSTSMATGGTAMRKYR